MLYSAHWPKKRVLVLGSHNRIRKWSISLEMFRAGFSPPWCPGFCKPQEIHHLFANLRAVSRTSFWCSFEWWQFQLMKVLISETRLPQIGNLAVRYLKYRILIGKISGLRWFFTKRGRKFYFAQTFLDDSPTFLVVIKRPETSLFLLVFHLQENFGDTWNSKFWRFLRITHLLRRISQKVEKQQVREFQTFLTIIFSRCRAISGLEKKFRIPVVFIWILEYAYF